MDPSTLVYDVFLHAFGDTVLKFALEAGRAVIWVSLAYYAAKKFNKSPV